MIKKLIIMITSSVFVFSMACGNENIWETFVTNPNQVNFEKCQEQIKDALSGRYERYQSPTYKQLMENGAIGKLLNLVENGNIYANELCYQLFPLFRSHGHVEILETFDIDLGKLIKKDPESFLMLLKKYMNRQEGEYLYLEAILCALGDEFVDEYAKQIQEIKERIESLQIVEKKELQELRDSCIKILMDHKNLISEAIIEFKTKEEKN